MNTILEALQRAFTEIDVAMGLFIAVLLVFTLASLLAHIYVYAYYHLQVRQIQKTAEITTLEEIKKLKGFLKETVKTFEHGSKKGQIMDPHVVTKKQIYELSLLNWSFLSMEDMLIIFPFTFLGISIILSILLPETVTLILLSLSLFFILFILNSIFSVRQEREKLEQLTIAYIHENLARFFIPDTSNAISLLRHELNSSIAALSVSLKLAIEKSNEHYEKLATNSFEHMIQLTEKAVILQKDLPVLFEENTRISVENIKNLENIIKNMDGKLMNQLENMDSVILNMTKEIEGRAALLLVTEENYKNLAISQRTLHVDIDSIEKNQKLLDTSIHAFQVALQEMMNTVGSGFGTILEFQAQGAYKELHDDMMLHMNYMNEHFRELMDKMEHLMTENTRYAINDDQKLVNLLEQMEGHILKITALLVANDS